MTGNPFTEMISMLRNDILKRIPVFYRLGKVTSTNPIRIETGGTVQGRNDLLKNSAINESSLTIGDTVVLLPIEDNQRFIILCKVVGL